MSSAYNKRIEYGNKASDSNKRRGTKGGFTPSSVRMKESSITNVDLERGVVNQTAVRGESAKEKTDEQVEREEHKDPDYKDFDHSKLHTQNQASTKPSMPQTVELGGVYAKIWGHVSTRTIPRVTYSATNKWLPSSIGMMQIINGMHSVLDGNEYLRRIAPNYLSMSVTLYYAVLWYVQILRAQTAAKTIGKNDSSWLRGFLRTYGEESLVIAGPLVPLFNSITSVLTENVYNDWIVPSLPDNLAKAESGATLSPHHDLIPNVPALFDLLHTFCNLNTIGNNNFENNEFVKFPITSGGTIGGFTVAPTPGNSRWVLSNPGLDNTFPETMSKYIEVHRAWSRTKIRAEPAITDQTSLKSIGEWLRMSTSYTWFADCQKMATLQASRFLHPANLSQISTTGRLDVLIQCEYFAPRKADGTIGTIDLPDKWYPQRFSSLLASFKTREVETTTEDMWNAFSTQSLACGPRGTPKHGCQDEYRNGKYWANEQFQFHEEYPFAVNEGLETLYITSFYKADGN